MELYKFINNEALSEDNKAKRIVMERIRKNLIDTQQSSFKEMSPASKRAFLNAYYIFSDGLDNLLYDGEDGAFSGNMTDIGHIPQKYNQLALTISSMDYNTLNPTDKSYINGLMDKTLQKLMLIKEIANDENLPDAFQVPLIINNIIGRLYKPIFYPERDIKYIPKLERQKETKGTQYPYRIAPGVETQTGEDEDENENEGAEQPEIEEEQDIPEDEPNIPIPQAPPQAQVVQQAPWWNYWE